METPRWVLDTDVVVDHLRRRSHLLVDALRHFPCAFTTITSYELAAVRDWREKQRSRLDGLMSRVQVLPLDQSGARQAAEIWHTLANRGAIIGLPDILSAGICLANDLPLLTRSVEHFNRIEGLKLLTPDGLQAQIDEA